MVGGSGMTGSGKQRQRHVVLQPTILNKVYRCRVDSTFWSLQFSTLFQTLAFLVELLGFHQTLFNGPKFDKHEQQSHKQSKLAVCTCFSFAPSSATGRSPCRFFPSLKSDGFVSNRSLFSKHLYWLLDPDVNF